MWDPATEGRIKRLETMVRSEKLMVAFVAEFSRGKSEMINAIFFASYGQRIMPAGAGRTTMCPTEIGFEPQVAPSLRLLPIQTRLRSKSLADWRTIKDAWVCSVLDVNDADQLRSTLERVTDTLRVSPQEAQALGFWHSQTPQSNPPLDAQGKVEIPKWRHALVNIDHPLLKQGLVILDTPGLNAIGAEPELTVGLIAQAQAVVFILGADTGVTQSDLDIWQQHLANDADSEGATLVVLNKIDTLWDELSSDAQIQAQINLQRTSASELLGVVSSQVLAVSAQKGLIAKVSNNRELLARSGIMELESALAHGMLGQRHKFLRATVKDALLSLETDIGRTIDARARDLNRQLDEMNAMRGKSKIVLNQMRHRIASEQQQFERGCSKFLAFKSVQAKLFQKIVLALDQRGLAREMELLAISIAQPGLKLGLKKAYGDTFDRLRYRLRNAQETADELQAMHATTFEQINLELSLGLQCVIPPPLEGYLTELDLAELHHAKYVGFRNVIRLQQPEFTRRLVGALESRVRKLYESVVSDVDSWRKNTVAILDVQTGLRRANFSQRLETVEQVEFANDGLQQRLGQVLMRKQALDGLPNKLAQQTACLVAANEDAPTEDTLISA